MGGHDSPPPLAQNPQSNRAAKILLFLHKKMVNYKIEFNQNALFLLKKVPHLRVFDSYANCTPKISNVKSSTHPLNRLILIIRTTMLN